MVLERIPEHVPGGGCAVAIASLGIKTLGFSQRGRSFVGLTKPLRSPPFAGTCLGEDELRTQHQSLLRGATGRLLLQLEVAERFCRQGFCEVDSSIISFGRGQLAQTFHRLKSVFGLAGGCLLRGMFGIVVFVSERSAILSRE